MPPVVTGTDAVTALTDLFAGLLIIPLIVILCCRRTEKAREKTRWIYFFVLLSAANLLGFTVHYFCWSRAAWNLLWLFLYAVLFETVNAFFLLVMERREMPVRKAALWLRIASLAVYLPTALLPLICGASTIRVYTAYALITALAGFSLCIRPALRERRSAERLLLSTLLPLLPAAYFQLERKTVLHLVWTFDCNGLAHLCIIASIILFFLAARESLSESKISVS